MQGFIQQNAVTVDFNENVLMSKISFYNVFFE